jgi:hypothetical protein
MNPTRQDRNTDPGRQEPEKRNANPQSPQPEDERESTEEIRHNSRTAQDREHTIRRGDNVTTQTKEFPT